MKRCKNSTAFDNSGQSLDTSGNNWNTENVTNMSYMFVGATTFNQYIGGWNTKNVLYLNFMFRDATYFNKEIRTWNIDSIIAGGFAYMFNDANSFISTYQTANGFGTTPSPIFWTSYQQPISNICFPAGTPVLTDQGNIPIDKIDIHKHTIRNKPIVCITKTISLDKNIVCIHKNALAQNIPSQKTLISKNHAILYKGKMTKAKDLVWEVDNVEFIKYDKLVLYNVLMEEHDKIIVNNLICETLHPKNGVAEVHRILLTKNKQEQQLFIKKYNNFATTKKIFNNRRMVLGRL